MLLPGRSGRAHHRRRWLAVGSLVSLSVLAVPARAIGPTGALHQLSGRRGCIGERAGDGCRVARELAGATGIAVAPDGGTLYATSFRTGAVSAFETSPDGSLKQLRGKAGCVSRRDSRCTLFRGLLGSTGVTVSPDGRSVYVASLSADQLSVFRRDLRTGRLSRLRGQRGCVSRSGGVGCARGRSMYGITDARVSPDGRNVYAITQNAVAVFARDRATGALRQLPGRSGCLAGRGAGGCTPVRGLGLPDSIVVRADGKAVYVAGASRADVLALVRDRRSGALRQLPGGQAGCGAASVGVDCPVLKVRGEAAFNLSPDGRHAYATSPGHVDVLDLRARTGTVRRVARAPGRLPDPYDLAVSPDGRTVYVTGDGPVRVAAFARDPATGRLTQLTGAGGCVAARAQPGCTQARRITTPRYMAVSPDGGAVYVTSARAGRTPRSGTIAVFSVG